MKIALLAAAAAGALAAAPAAAWTGPCVPGTALPRCEFSKGKLVWVADGDTVDVRVTTRAGRRKTVRVRLTGVQAMEQSAYARNPRKRRGACHALAATARLEQLAEIGRSTVRLGAQDPGSASGRRVRRSLAVRIGRRWRDVGRILIAEGHALWLPHPVEYAWNSTYNALAQQAAAARVNLWSTSACGPGPSETAPLRLRVHPDAPGDDRRNLNGERVQVENLDPLAPVPLAGWWLRDSTLRRFVFPPRAVIPPGGAVTVRVGGGAPAGSTFHWGLEQPVFENARRDGRGMGDGAYLFDPQGDLRAWEMYPCLVGCAPDRDG